MLLRRSAAPKELIEQADRAEELARAVARYFEEPSDASAESSAQAAASCGQAAKSTRAALKSLDRSARREDWLFICGALADLCEFCARAAAKAKVLNAEPRPELWPAARDLRQAAAALKSSLRGASSRAQDLVEGKRRASGADTAVRRLERAALEEPRFVAGLKDREVLHWLSEAAHAAQQAAERLAEVLGQES